MTSRHEQIFNDAINRVNAAIEADATEGITTREWAFAGVAAGLMNSGAIEQLEFKTVTTLLAVVNTIQQLNDEIDSLGAENMRLAQRITAVEERLSQVDIDTTQENRRTLDRLANIDMAIANIDNAFAEAVHQEILTPTTEQEHAAGY